MIGHLQKQYSRKFSVTREGSTSAISNATGVTSLVFSHTTGSGVNRAIVVTTCGVSCGAAGDVTGVIWNGIPLTQFRKGAPLITGTACYNNYGIFYLLNPAPNTTADVVVSFSVGNACSAQANNYYYVSQATPMRAFNISSSNVSNDTISLGLTTTHQNSYVVAHTCDDTNVSFSANVTKRAGDGTKGSMADGFFPNASGITIVSDGVTTNLYQMSLSEVWAN